ncbi:MAG: hypothetical protein J4428_05345 [Candidatus Aenigmarchaeota archaeon]|nr:hypothetical protein [Candidatus Aenigmarchaeota archaeon]
MAKIVMQDDCLAPDLQITLNFKGPNPIIAYQKLKRAMRDVWEVEAKDYWEREFRWDTSGDPREFLVKAYVVKMLDRFSRVIIEIYVHGHQPSDPSKSGDVEVRIGGYLKTEFGGKGIIDDARNPLYKGLLWMYNKYFYWGQRRYYLHEWCYKKLHKFRDIYQKILNISPPMQ